MEIKFRGLTIEEPFFFYGLPRIYKSGRAEIFDGDGSYYVDKTTISQFTGQLDKNGVEIYLGDIIRTKKRVGVVKFGNGGYNIDGWAISFLSEHHEVIGNVYQNGDLIK